MSKTLYRRHGSKIEFVRFTIDDKDWSIVSEEQGFMDQPSVTLSTGRRQLTSPHQAAEFLEERIQTKKNMGFKEVSFERKPDHYTVEEHLDIVLP